MARPHKYARAAPAQKSKLHPGLEALARLVARSAAREDFEKELKDAAPGEYSVLDQKGPSS